MRINSFYRIAIWAPIAVPAVVYGLERTVAAVFGVDAVTPAFGILPASLVYGGIPYGALALWASWRIGGYSEPQIKRLMFRSPWLMIAAFTLFLFLGGWRVGRPEFGLLGPLGAIFIIPLGYGYIGVVLLIREEMGERLHP